MKKIINKMNSVDFIIIAFIIIFLVGGFMRLNKVDEMTVDKSDTFEMTMLFEEVSIGFAENVKTGDSIKDSVRGFVIGEVTNVIVKEHREMISTDEKIEYAVIPNEYDLTVELKGQGLFDGNGVLIGSRRYFIGSESRIKSDLYVTNVEVIDLKKSEE
jgi:hypothetical protein